MQTVKVKSTRKGSRNLAQEDLKATLAYPPLKREVLISQGQCCGNERQNCPYIPKHTKGSKDYNR